jgi:hypothetical protein
MSTTPETSVSFNPERELEVTVGTVKRLLEMAYKHYNEAARIDSKSIIDYWDGYIRACKHILEADGQ